MRICVRNSLTIRCVAEGDAAPLSSKGEGEVSIGWRRKEEAEAAADLPTGVMPCIPVPAERMSLPGQLREVHLYDVSNLAVAEYCMRHTGGYYVQAVIEPEALAARKFRLCEYGVLRKIISSRASIHRNNLGERSDSRFAKVLSVCRVSVGNVTQNEPFVAAKVAAAPLEYLENLPGISADISHVTALYAKCERLRLRLGERALKGTRFADLSDLRDEANDKDPEDAIDKEGSSTPTFSSQAAPPDDTAMTGDPLTPEELRAMVQRRVADAAREGLTNPLTNGQAAGDPWGALLDFSALKKGTRDPELGGGAHNVGELMYAYEYACMYIPYIYVHTYYVLINPRMPIYYVLAAVFASCFYVLKSLLQE